MAIFDNMNPFAGCKKAEEKLACYWYNQLWNKAISLFEWSGPLFEGPAATLNSDYLEWTLMSRGQAAFIKDKQGKLRGLDCSTTGYDPYMFPTTIRVVNPQIKGELTGTVGVNAVWVRNNKFAVPVISTIQYYASQLAKIQVSLNVSLANNRMTKVFTADNDAQAQQIRKMIDDVDAGKLAVIMKGDIFDSIMGKNNGSAIPVYSTPSEYLADKYLQDMRNVLNDFMTTFGINSSGANMVKHERNLTSEVNSNNQEILVNRAYWLECREKAAEDASNLFDTEINVTMRGDDLDDRSRLLDNESEEDILEPEV